MNSFDICLIDGYWHEWLAFQLVTVQAVDWHYDSGPLFSLFFSTFLFFSFTTFPYKRSARIKKLIQQKLTGAPKNLGVHNFSIPIWALSGPQVAILDFQVVWHCRR